MTELQTEVATVVKAVSYSLHPNERICDRMAKTFVWAEQTRDQNE